MPRVKENRARERRIKMDVVVDAYNSDERAMGWYCYLEEQLKFPFRARCKARREISPLRVGEEIEVVGMASEREGLSEMFVRVRWRGRRLAVPLAQLEPLKADAPTTQAVADWHYWIGRGYEF
jgi:hypothetical protein